MADTYAAGAAELRFVGTNNGNPDPWTTGIGIMYGVTADPFIHITDTVELFGTNMDTLLQDMSSDTTISQWIFTWQTGLDETTSIDGVFGDVYVGGGADDAFAPQAAYVLRKRAASGGRHGRGRNFLPGVREASVVDGRIEPGVLNDMNNHIISWGEAIVAGLADITADAHLVINSVSNSVPVPLRIVQSVYSDQVGWLRRRGPLT